MDSRSNAFKYFRISLYVIKLMNIYLLGHRSRSRIKDPCYVNHECAGRNTSVVTPALQSDNNESSVNFAHHRHRNSSLQYSIPRQHERIWRTESESGVSEVFSFRLVVIIMTWQLGIIM